MNWIITTFMRYKRKTWKNWIKSRWWMLKLMLSGALLNWWMKSKITILKTNLESTKYLERWRNWYSKQTHKHMIISTKWISISWISHIDGWQLTLPVNFQCSKSSGFGTLTSLKRMDFLSSTATYVQLFSYSTPKKWRLWVTKTACCSYRTCLLRTGMKKMCQC
jgi:hypothetical protein